MIEDTEVDPCRLIVETRTCKPQAWFCHAQYFKSKIVENPYMVFPQLISEALDHGSRTRLTQMPYNSSLLPTTTKRSCSVADYIVESQPATLTI